MIKQSRTYSKFFNIDHSVVNKKKIDLLVNKAVEINKFKNLISKAIHDDILEYRDSTKYEMNGHFGKLRFEELSAIDPNHSFNKNDYKNILNYTDRQEAIIEVWTTYRMDFARIKQNMSFKVYKEIKITHYKINTKEHVKGSVKSVTFIQKQTPLTNCLRFLCRYGHINITEEIKYNLSVGKWNDDEKLQAVYENILYYLIKFGEERLLTLAISKRERLIKSISLHDFKSLSYKTQNRTLTKNIVTNNYEKKSRIDGFITSTGYAGYKQLNIPIKISNSYHGKLDEYSDSYIVKFKGNKPYQIILTKTQDEFIPENNTNYLGVDTNIKNNLFATSDGFDININEKLIQGYSTFLLKMDNRAAMKDKCLSKKLSSRRKTKYKFWLTRIHNMIIEKAVQLIKTAKSKGYNHLVLEDLNFISSKLPSMNQDYGIKNGRMIKMLQLGSVKDTIHRIAWKYGLNVSFVQPEHTSQTCSVCGNIDPNNRKYQEEFVCTVCGHANNADTNSSINIRNRIELKVLAESLLSFNGYEFEPKILKHERVKEILIDYFDVDFDVSKDGTGIPVKGKKDLKL